MSAVAGGPPERPGGAGPDGGPAEEAPLEVPPPTMTPRLAAATLLLESFVVFFATIVASRLITTPDGPSVGAVFAVGSGLAVVFLLASGLARRPWGVALGTGLQVVLVSLGFVVTSMFLVGLLFAGLWAWLVWIGRKVDRDRRRWAADLASGGTGRP